MKNTIYIVILLLLLTIISFIHFRGVLKLNKLEKKINKEKNLFQGREQYFSMIIDTYFIDFGKNLKDISLVDQFGMEKKLEDINKNNYLLLFFVSDEHCSLCIEAVLPELKRVENKLLKKNIIIIGDFQNYRNMLLFKKNNNLLGFSIYTVKNSMGLDLNKRNVPFFILLDKNYQTINTFVPEKKLLEYTRTYLNSLKYLFN